MSITKTFSIILFAAFLSLFVSSFLFYLVLPIPPLVFFIFFVFVYNIVEDYRKSEGLFVAVFSGLCVDVFSSGTVVGFYTLIFFVFAHLIKIIQKKYVGISVFS